MKTKDGKRKQKGGWEYDDGEGGYYKRTDKGTAYILGEGRSWSGTIRLKVAADHRGTEFVIYETSLKQAKADADYYVGETK